MCASGGDALSTLAERVCSELAFEATADAALDFVEVDLYCDQRIAI
jgi:hypothetical protein